MIKQILTFDFSPESSPFEEDKGKGLIWGRIKLNVVDQRGKILQEVINMVWDVRELMEWFLKNEWFLQNEEFPEKYVVSGNSIAELRWRYYKLRTGDNIDDEADEVLYQFATRHDIYYPMTGTKTIHAFIGKRAGKREISFYYGPDENWRYDIELEDTMAEVRKFQERYSGN